MADRLPTSLLMFIAHRYAEGQVYAAVREAGFVDFTIAQGRLAAGIDPDGTRLSVLAERAHVAKQTATALVDSLERAGYVERAPDPVDGRARLVRLTPRGWDGDPRRSRRGAADRRRVGAASRASADASAARGVGAPSRDHRPVCGRRGLKGPGTS